MPLIPNAVLLELAHSSSITQHIQSNPTNYGYSTVSVYLHWDIGKHGYLDVGDGYCINSALDGRLREVFSARLGYRFDIGRH